MECSGNRQLSATDRMVYAKQAFESACGARAEQKTLETLYDLMIQRAQEVDRQEQEQEEE